MLGNGVRSHWSSYADVCVCPMRHARARRGLLPAREGGKPISWGKAMLSIEERCVAATVATGIVVVLVAAWLLG
jgi:hypothetical protein